MARDLKLIYTAATEGEAEAALEEFGANWDAKYPTISKSWRNNWTRVIPFFSHPPEIRRIIYTINAIESLNMSLRKVTKARGSFLLRGLEKVTTEIGFIAIAHNLQRFSLNPAI